MTGVEMLEMVTNASGASEAYHRTDFTVYRRRKDGMMQEVSIQVFDGGPAMGSLRYHVRAISQEGRKASGNHAESLEVALAIVHWGDLDRDRDPWGGPLHAVLPTE